MANKEKNDIELPEKTVNNGNDNSDGEVEKEVNKPFLTKLKNFILFFTVEPFLLCFVLPNIITSMAVQEFNLLKACRADLNYTEYVCTQALSGDSSENITQTALAEAQIMVAEMTSWKQPVQSAVPAVVTLFVGAWSDRTGNRKYLMLIPIFGEFISAIGLLFTNYFFLEWPLWLTGLIQALPTTFTGGFPIALLGSYSYVADVTTVESRTFRIGCLGLIVTLGIPLATSISGVLTEEAGYYGVFGIHAFLCGLGFVYVYFRIHDIKCVKTEDSFLQKIINFFHPKNASDTLSILFLTPKNTLIQIWLIVWAHILVLGPVYGESASLFSYALKTFNMDLVEFSLFSTYCVLLGIAGTSTAAVVLSKYFKIHDDLIGAIATSSKVLSSFMYGLAPNKTWFYTAPVIDFLGNTGTIVVRSLGTKVVQPDDVGKMCSILSVVEAILPIIYVPIYTTLYAKTLETLPGAFYILGAMMSLPATFIFIYLYFMHKRQEKDVVKDPKAKEMFAHENAVTVL